MCVFCVISAIPGTNRAFIVLNGVKLCSIREKFTIILQKVYENCEFSLKITIKFCSIKNLL